MNEIIKIIHTDSGDNEMVIKWKKDISEVQFAKEII